MTCGAERRLLRADDPPVCTVERPAGESAFVLIADHAGCAMPRRLGNLGLSPHSLATHIGSDLGIAALARRVSEQLDAWLIEQNYSRLVIDVNRSPGTPQSILTISERTPIAGNRRLSRSAAAVREREIFRPYHAHIRAELDRRLAARRPAILCALHSFTPSFLGMSRPWHVGVLYNRDARFGHALLERLRADGEVLVGDNEPYAASDATDYSIIEHGERRGLLHVELEIRQDLIIHEAGQAVWSQRLADLLRQTHAAVGRG